MVSNIQALYNNGANAPTDEQIENAVENSPTIDLAAIIQRLNDLENRVNELTREQAETTETNAETADNVPTDTETAETETDNAPTETDAPAEKENDE